MKDNLQLKPSGILTYDVYEHGELIERCSDNNLVVSQINDVIAKLLGFSAGYSPITQLGVGTNGTPPVIGNTSLTGLQAKGINSVSQPVSGQVQFNFTIGTGDFNGIAISEFGLLTSSGVLVARKTRTKPLNKTTSININGYWILTP